MHQFVVPDQPDLVLTYTNGTWERVRQICRKHDVEFIENRRELADYLRRIGEEPTALLGDAVHQNAHGRIRIWDNIVRHIAEHPKPSYDPRSRERRCSLVSPPESGNERIVVSEEWNRFGDLLIARKQGARIRIEFEGKRLDIIGRKCPDGGAVRVTVDGVPGDEVPVHFTNHIQPGRDNQRVLKGPGPGDVAPHAVSLGENVLPQCWTITMSSDTGDYKLEGTVTGFDGKGNANTAFTSDSGQILIDPALWRHTGPHPRTGEVRYGNRAGDTFQFDVYRCSIGNISFQSSEPTDFHQPLVQDLPNGRHAVEIVTADDREVAIDRFYVYEPPVP